MKNLAEEFEQSRKWTGVLLQITEEVNECLVCGEPVESVKEGMGLRMRCPNDHEVKICIVSENN